MNARQVRKHEIQVSTHGLELTTIVHVLEIWRHYMVGYKHDVCTDHQSEVYFQSVKYRIETTQVVGIN